MTMTPSDRVIQKDLSNEELSKLYRIDDFEAIAHERLSQMTFAYYAGGAGDERTLSRNRSAWEAISIWYRVMVDVSKRSPATTMLNMPLSFPLLVAPTALHKMAHCDGEVATARACGALGVPMVVSSLSTTSIEEICAAARSPILFQMYIGQDRGFLTDLVRRVEQSGCVALQLTVDTPVWGLREREMKTGFCVPPDMSIVNLERKGDGPKGHTGVGIGETLGWTITPSLCWKDLEWLCGVTKLPVMVKGICRADDALTAVRCGAKGIVVSNHGGRQLDGAPPTAEALPRIAQAVASRVPVLVDGGIRHGGDILKALALGATAVQIGRPILWGLAAGGENGVKRVIDILAQDFDRVMALSGCPTIASITRDLLEPSR